MSQKRLQLKTLSGRRGRPLLYAKSNEKKQPVVVKVGGGDQILLVPTSFKDGGDASHGSHRVVAPMHVGLLAAGSSKQKLSLMTDIILLRAMQCV